MNEKNRNQISQSCTCKGQQKLYKYFNSVLGIFDVLSRLFVDVHFYRPCNTTSVVLVFV